MSKPKQTKFVARHLPKPKHREEYTSVESYQFLPWRVTLQVRMADDRDLEPYEVFCRGAEPMQAAAWAQAVFCKIERGRTPEDPSILRCPTYNIEGDTSEAEIISEEEWMDKLRYCLSRPHSIVSGGHTINDPIFVFRIQPQDWIRGKGRGASRIVYTPTGSNLYIPQGY